MEARKAGSATGERAQKPCVCLLCIAEAAEGGRREHSLCSARQQLQVAKGHRKGHGRAGPKVGSRREPKLVIERQGWA